ncbi:MAG: hypothetical protein GC165_16530 [Armatimonadetes bacterium]|nr:hypothetical protein [Armatimonadota bacterium]
MQVVRNLALGALAVTIFACGGVTSGVKTTSFGTPVVIAVPDNGNTTLTGFAANGKMVGNFVANGSSTSVPYYWESPTATPAMLQGTDCYANAINSSGAIVGNMQTGSGNQLAAFWGSPQSAPVTLPEAPATPHQTNATSINESNVIVGQDGSFGVYWDASHATAYAFGGPNLEGVYNAAIADSGTIYFTIYSSLTNNLAHRLCTFTNFPNEPAAYVPGTNAHSAYSEFVALNRFRGQAAILDTNLGGVPSGSEVLLDPAFAPSQLTGTDARVKYVGDDGVYCGAEGFGVDQFAVIWQSGISKPVNMNNLIPPGSGLVLTDALFQTSDGGVIGIARQTSSGKSVYVYVPRAP